MIKTVCAFFSSSILALIFVYYSDFKFKTKTSKQIAVLSCCGFAFVCFIANISGLFFLIPVSLAVCGFAYDMFICKAKPISALFSSVSLSAVYALCSQMFQPLLYSVFGADNNGHFMSVTQIVLSLSAFIAAVYVITRFSERKSHDYKAISLPLFLMPLVTGFISFLFAYISNKYVLSDIILLLLSLSYMLLLLSNVTAIYIHEVSVKKREYADEIRNENVMLKSREEYYSELKLQNESSRVLIHDISKHLNTIGHISKTDESVAEYIRGLSDEYGVTNPVDYCGNPTLNLITHRFYEKCRISKIRFDVNIRESKIEFMSAPDITALFDNLLENAYEAALEAKDKFIDFSIYIRNKNFIIIQLINSYSTQPQYSGDELVTRKKAPMHGIGTRSIKRIVKKYDGDIFLSFNECNSTFEAKVMLKTRTYIDIQ